MYNQTTTWIPLLGTFFCQLANCFLPFCSDLAVLILPTLFVILKVTIESRHRVLWVGTYSYLTPSPLYCFTLMGRLGNMIYVLPSYNVIQNHPENLQKPPKINKNITKSTPDPLIEVT